MHQSGHSRAQSMHEVQFSSVSAMTPRDRGGSAGDTSGYSAVCVCRVSDFAVVASPLTSPGMIPSATCAHLFLCSLPGRDPDSVPDPILLNRREGTCGPLQTVERPRTAL